MPFGISEVFAGLGAAGSLAGGLSGLFGNHNSPNSVQIPQIWQMPNMSAAANDAFSGIGGLGGYNTGGQTLGQYGDITQSMVNNPYAGSALPAALGAAPYGVNAGIQAGENAALLGGQPMSLVPYATQMLQQGFDPQNDLYARTQQRVTDQTRAGLETRGIDNTPYGAGVEGDVLKNFNIDWQNTQLGREQTAAQGASGLISEAGQAAQGAAQLGYAAPQGIVNSAMLPYSTFNTLGGNNLGFLNSLAQAGITGSQIPQTQVQDYLSYVGTGNQANSVANQTGQLGLNQQQQQFNQNQVYGKQVGQGLSGFANMFQNTNWNNPWANSGGGGGGGQQIFGPGY